MLGYKLYQTNLKKKWLFIYLFDAVGILIMYYITFLMPYAEQLYSTLFIIMLLIISVTYCDKVLGRNKDFKGDLG